MNVYSETRLERPPVDNLRTECVKVNFYIPLKGPKSKIQSAISCQRFSQENLVYQFSQSNYIIQSVKIKFLV